MTDQPIDNVVAFEPSNAVPSSAPRVPLYQLTKLVWRKDGRCSMIDRYGDVMIAETAFLNDLFNLCEVATFRSYARILLDISRILAVYDNGRGLHPSKITDAFLIDRLRPEYLSHRGVQLATFRRVMMILFRFLLYAERHGFIRGVIGNDEGGANFKVNLPLGNYSEHPVMAGREVRNVTRMPTHRDFDVVEAATMTLITSRSIKRQLHLMLRTAKKLGFRRRELVGMTTALIPTKYELSKLREAAESGRKPWTVAIPVQRAKKGGIRDAHFPISLLEELREFIDTDRNDHLKPGVQCDAIFVSTKTGRALEPSYVTNLIKRGSHKAAALHRRGFGDLDLRLVHPHHYRHRAATDMLVGFLKSGMAPLEAVLTTMDALGIKSFSTVSVYLRLAQAEIEGARSYSPTNPPGEDTPPSGGAASIMADLDILHELTGSANRKSKRGRK